MKKGDPALLQESEEGPQWTVTRLRSWGWTCHYVQNGGSGDQKFSFKRSAQVITMAKDKVKQQAYLKGTMNYRKVGS